MEKHMQGPQNDRNRAITPADILTTVYTSRRKEIIVLKRHLQSCSI